jgi:hypothetical protein
MITVMFEFAGVSASQYDEACRLANASQSNLPDGLVFHSASPTPTGFLVVDVWESEDKFKAFGERLRPAMEQAGISQQPAIYPTHAIMGSRAPVAV